MTGVVIGPGSSWAVALPGPEGLPAVFGPALASDAGLSWEEAAPWLAVFAPSDGCLVMAIAVSAIEPLPAFHARVAGALGAQAQSSGLLPPVWERRRREARGNGVGIDPGGWKRLEAWARRLGVEMPEPVSG